MSRCTDSSGARIQFNTSRVTRTALSTLSKLCAFGLMLLLGSLPKLMSSMRSPTTWPEYPPPLHAYDCTRTVIRTCCDEGMPPPRSQQTRSCHGHGNGNSRLCHGDGGVAQKIARARRGRRAHLAQTYWYLRTDGLVEVAACARYEVEHRRRPLARERPLRPSTAPRTTRRTILSWPH